MTSDTLTEVNHHTWDAEGWSKVADIAHQLRQPSAVFTGEFCDLT